VPVEVANNSLLIELGFDEGNALCADRVADDAKAADVKRTNIPIRG
jgi:hypothetical protein